MNYNDFIKSVDEKLATMSDNEKDKWIHNLARTIQENERAKFLNSLNSENNCEKIIYDIKEIQDWSIKKFSNSLMENSIIFMKNVIKKIKITWVGVVI